jgi:hypothetical protein
MSTPQTTKAAAEAKKAPAKKAAKKAPPKKAVKTKLRRHLRRLR